LALVPSRGRVYAWGLGGVGQLGNRAAQSATTPQVVLGPWVLPSGSLTVVEPYYSPQIEYIVKHIFCGGDHCFATVIPKKVGAIFLYIPYWYSFTHHWSNLYV